MPRLSLTTPQTGTIKGCRLVVVLCAFSLVLLGPSPLLAGALTLKGFAKAPEALKINAKLLKVEKQVRMKSASLTRAAQEMAVGTVGHQLQVNLVTRSIGAQAVSRLQQPGMTVLHASPTYHRVVVALSDPSQLFDLAKLSEVRMIMPEYGALNRVGAVGNRADIALRSDAARTAFGVDGTGQLVGILSDSFALSPGVRDENTEPARGEAGILTGSRPQDSGDLPLTVDIRRDESVELPDILIAGTDEGAGMAELVHDIAPGAGLAFHTAFGGMSVFADGITDLCMTAGATVVVDDIIYFGEPMYQDGIIAQAAADCVAQGVPFFSAAGNEANRGFKQVFSDIDPIDDMASPPSGKDFHDWGEGNGFLEITVPPGGSFVAVLQWNQPFQSVSPESGAQIDLDMYVVLSRDAFGLAFPIASSTDIQGVPRGLGDALEILNVGNPLLTPVTMYLAIDHFRGSQEMIPQDEMTPLEFRLVFFESGPESTIQGIDDGTSDFGGPTIYGHSMAEGVTSVAAIPWFDTPEFDPTLSDTEEVDPEFFTSRGGELTVQFDRNGNFAPRTSFEPDIAAVDGNNTTFFGLDINFINGFEGEPDGFPNFFGTSAAAPNAAAVAALMRQVDATLSPAEIEFLMQVTALDVAGFRAAVGPDDVTGTGLINAVAALDALRAPPIASFQLQ